MSNRIALGRLSGAVCEVPDRGTSRPRRLTTPHFDAHYRCELECRFPLRLQAPGARRLSKPQSGDCAPASSAQPIGNSGESSPCCCPRGQSTSDLHNHSLSPNHRTARMMPTEGRPKCRALHKMGRIDQRIVRASIARCYTIGCWSAHVFDAADPWLQPSCTRNWLTCRSEDHRQTPLAPFRTRSGKTIRLSLLPRFRLFREQSNRRTGGQSCR